MKSEVRPVEMGEWMREPKEVGRAGERKWSR